MPTEQVGRWQRGQNKGSAVGGDGEGRVVLGGVGADSGKMRGKRVEQIRRESMHPGTVGRDMDRVVVIVERAVEAIVVDGWGKSDRWQEKNAGGG